MRITKNYVLFGILPLLLLSVGCGMPPPVRVMTFNIRYGTAPDGENRWEMRRDLVLDTVRANSPDVLGLQEVLSSQAQELRAAFPEYEFVGVGRDDGAEAGEFEPIMYRRNLFNIKEFGYIWLSPEPDKPGVKGWDAACPRMLTWVHLGFKRYPGQSFYVINTHFDHVGVKARVESAKIVRNLTDTLSGKAVIVMGDFNSTPDSPAYEILTGDRGNLAELHDVHRARERSETDAGTFHGFQGERTGDRIDWILFTRRLEAVGYSIDPREQSGRYPSDHFPVIADLRLSAAR
jgi:endonuclease/exonuclease/phosphatase family metal-dependent hydrolase